MKAIVDRIEDGIITLEINNNYFNCSVQKFPKGIKEGDLIDYKDGKIVILVEETKGRTEKIRNLFDSLLEKNE